MNPYRLEGQKTAAFEVWGTIGSSTPDVLAIPVGNDNISAYWKGFKEWHEKQKNFTKCMVLKQKVPQRDRKGQDWSNLETVATAIRIGKSCWLAISRTEHAMNRWFH